VGIRVGIDGLIGHKIGKPINAPPFFRNFVINLPVRKGISYFLFVDEKTKNFLGDLNRADMIFVDLGEIHSRWNSVFSLQVRGPQLIRKFNIDVFCSIATNDLPLWCKCKKVLRVSSLAHCHCNGSAFKMRSLVYRKLLTRIFIDRADLVIANSLSMENDIKKIFKLPASKLKMIPEAIDPAYLVPMDEDKAICDVEKLGVGRPYIMFASTLAKQKNPEILLKAFVHLRTKHKITHKLVFVGSGTLEKPMREYAGAWGVGSDVIFTGYIEKEKLISLYKLADIVVHPSLYEATGNITLQAMAMGVPLIAANILSIPEMVGDAAVLFDPYSENDLVDSILRVLKDKNLRDTLIEKGHKRVKQFSSWQPLMEQFMDEVVSLVS
jgi:glycosyltransferase involved in cell wall biosynthesis